MTPHTFRHIEHEADFCVVGGGMAGYCAALAAAREGARTILINDRTAWGGNASSEIRVGIAGADRSGNLPHMRETGILEALRMENLYRNPHCVYGIWDTILHDKVMTEPHLTGILNCTVNALEMDGERIASVTGWQTTTETRHTVRAKVFADCTGDGILAPLSGAEFRMGREGRDEYGESIAPEKPDDHTMGMTIAFTTQEYDTPQPFRPPSWAHRYENCDELPKGAGGHRRWHVGFWWVELGGEHHSIHDADMLRDELLKIAYGVWDHIKNRNCEHRERARNWALKWIHMLPGKRESRRYVAEHVLTQGDIEAGGAFDDTVAYGGWTMDDHHWAGFRCRELGEPPTIFHPCPSPYGIPYRSLYSRNVPNLMCAGRDAGCSHVAMSSTRVMGTGSVMGQAVGVAAAIAAERGLDPSGVKAHMGELQQRLLATDCYLPGFAEQMPELTARATLTATQGDPEPVRDGVSRQVGDDPHAWVAHPGDTISYAFGESRALGEVALTLDSAMDKSAVFQFFGPFPNQLTATPEVMPRKLRIDLLRHGQWETAWRDEENYLRHRRIALDTQAEGVRLTIEATWGSDASRVYGFVVR